MKFISNSMLFAAALFHIWDKQTIRMYQNPLKQKNSLQLPKHSQNWKTKLKMKYQRSTNLLLKTWKKPSNILRWIRFFPKLCKQHTHSLKKLYVGWNFCMIFHARLLNCLHSIQKKYLCMSKRWSNDLHCSDVAFHLVERFERSLYSVN